MPIIKSAKKRVKVARKATVRNAKTKHSLRTALKAFHAKVTGDSHAKAQSNLDKAAFLAAAASCSQEEATCCCR